MKYEECKEGEIYKCYFREKDYWVIEFSGVSEKLFTGKKIFISKNENEGEESKGLHNFDTWNFAAPSEYELIRFYEKYPKIEEYEIY